MMIRYLILPLIVILWPVGGVSPARAAELSVADGLTSPGKATMLQARLTNPEASDDKGVPGQAIAFTVHGRNVGEAKTDTQGWARLEFTPSMRGNLPIVVQTVLPSTGETVVGKGVLLSWERRRPILLVDLATMMAEELDTDRPSEEQGQPSGLPLGVAHPAASAELWKLAEFYYNLIYLDLTGKGDLEHIQHWLRLHQFPPGMIRILPPAPTALPDLLTDLKEEGWEKVSGGIGRTVHFAEVLVQNRLQTVIFPLPETRERFPRRAIVLNDWSRIRKHL